ncbi:hypothetical protein DEU56DRAFT_842939 [Suillus clintonianus]|uniref:uncharacterized protein n=1 Tax=Suillus clintonianus TaxID=1904413 RepID=UPI001B87E865|nr:uncharacterized protein DEU56DRAFT_842939 [Suillus clintonianus]KAG2112100.1 hypothetical protein DEU56DRAFT_842939 [Suillus clintonianus]
MSEDIEQQISLLRKSRWVNLSGLVDCAMKRLSKPTCQSIQLLGNGSYNTVYKLVFVDGTEIAAGVSVHDDEDFNPQAKLSEIATMQFVRASGLYPDILVPQVHGWDITFSNPVVVYGRKLNDLNNNDNSLCGLDGMSEVQQLTITKTLAKLQSALSAPAPITLNDEGSSIMGPLFTLTQQNLGGPYKSLTDLWRTRLEDEILHAMREWSRLETDQLSQSLSEPKCTPQKFSELYQLLSSLIPHFVPPSSYLSLVLHHPDLALRNVFFDPTDDTKIVGLIDWGGAQILPLMLTAKDQGSPTEGWNTVPHNWTSFGDTSKWPKVFRGPNDQHFGVCFAQENHDRYGDYNTGRAMLFAHAPYYLKFHEIITGGWTAWVDHAEWVRETYWRVNAVKQNGRGDALIVGPNVYRNSMEKSVIDLSIFEEHFFENEKDYEEEEETGE